MTVPDTHMMEWIEEKTKRLNALRPLSPDLIQQLHEEMRVLHTYHSNAIEGNTLTLSDTNLSFQPVLPSVAKRFANTLKQRTMHKDTTSLSAWHANRHRSTISRSSRSTR